MVLDDRRVVVARAQSEGLKKLEAEKKLLKTELKDKSGKVITGLTNQLKDAQLEVTNLRATVELLERENAKLKEKKLHELDETEQRGYDLCFKEQIDAVKQIQGKLYQAGWESFG